MVCYSGSRLRHSLLLLMDPHNNLLIPQYDNHMPPNDIREDYQAPQMTQNYDTYQQPSGVEVTTPPTFLLRQAEISFPHLLQNDNTQASWAMTPPSIINPSTSSEASYCTPSSEDSVSPSPSHAYILRASHPGLGHSSIPPSPTYAHSFRSQPSTRSAALSRPSVPTLVPRGGAIPSDASPYIEAPRQDSAILRMSSTIAQPTSRVPVPTPLHLTGLFTDNFQAANAQDTLLYLNPLGHQSAPTPYQPFPEQSCLLPVTPNAHSPSFQSMDIIAVQSSQNQSGSSAVTDADDSSLSPASFSSQEDLVDAPPSPELPSAPAQGASSQAVDHQLLPQSVSQAVSQPANMQCHTRKRKRVAEPKDPKAAKRLRGQRQNDEDSIQALYDMFVPKGVEAGLKKNRLRLVRDYARKHVMMVNSLLQGASFQQNVGAQMAFTSQLRRTVTHQESLQLPRTDDGAVE
ncbi:hypothetical protein BJV78DRAFT_825330 [Lactifluus subvellereus]|nr:hypothetical protein BJV78DRAFT_825330 [Lactifluus subvellereus]